MGADLIGYTLIRPAKGAAKIANKQIEKVKSVLADSKLSDEKKVSKLIRLGAELSFSHDIDGMSDQEYLETIKSLVETTTDVELVGYYRDLNSRIATVRGRKVEILFAGDMSWGDEPQGAAYNALKSLVELGVSDAWEKAVSK